MAAVTQKDGKGRFLSPRYPVKADADCPRPATEKLPHPA